jgi:hypothetical protein
MKFMGIIKYMGTCRAERALFFFSVARCFENKILWEIQNKNNLTLQFWSRTFGKIWKQNIPSPSKQLNSRSLNVPKMFTDKLSNVGIHSKFVYKTKVLCTILQNYQEIAKPLYWLLTRSVPVKAHLDAWLT